jgi:hypothetical protein
MGKLGRVEVTAAALRDALYSAQHEITVGRDADDCVVVLPDIGGKQPATALKAGVKITKEASLRHYLRPFKPQTLIAVIPSRKLVGKAHGTSGVVARMRALSL